LALIYLTGFVNSFSMAILFKLEIELILGIMINSFF